MEAITRKKDQMCITTTPLLKKKTQALANADIFASVSDVVTMALTEFFNNHPEFKRILHELYTICINPSFLKFFTLKTIQKV